MSPKPSLAIIGTGISGLACAHFLKDHFELTLFEKDRRTGGHSNTVEVPGWGAGVTNALLRVQVRQAEQSFALRIALRNLFDRAHATWVVVNVGFGRVVEPGSARTVMVGVESNN